MVICNCKWFPFSQFVLLLKASVVAYLHSEFVPPDILLQCKVSPWISTCKISSSNGNYEKKNDKVDTNTYTKTAL